MKQFLALVLFLLTDSIGYCQNFIPNPDFSAYTACPTSYSQLNYCIGWYQPTGGTSDYYNACGGVYVNVPQNIFGYQSSQSNAYVGFYAYYPVAGYLDYKEYVGASFAPLTVGRQYTVSIKVSLADSSWYACDGLGIYFTTSQLSVSSYNTLSVTPQIDYSSYGIISDKVDWTTLTGTFIADQPYTNLAIGNFKTYNTVNVTRLSEGAADTSIISACAYYYLGLVSVDPLPPSPNNAVDTFKYWFPSAFTPDNDGLNDIFRLRYITFTDYRDYSLSIYNRFGQRVFFSTDVNAGWNGFFNNEPQDMGVYYYLAQFTIKGKRELLKGDITLVR